MIQAIKQAIRGCGTLPHVGPHPGTFWLVVFVLMGALAGAKGGWGGALTGGLVMLSAYGPIFLLGAYERAKDSDSAAMQRTSGGGAE